MVLPWFSHKKYVFENDISFKNITGKICFQLNLIYQLYVFNVHIHIPYQHGMQYVSDYRTTCIISTPKLHSEDI